MDELDDGLDAVPWTDEGFKERWQHSIFGVGVVKVCDVPGSRAAGKLKAVKRVRPRCFLTPPKRLAHAPRLRSLRSRARSRGVCLRRRLAVGCWLLAAGCGLRVRRLLGGWRLGSRRLLGAERERSGARTERAQSASGARPSGVRVERERLR